MQTLAVFDFDNTLTTRDTFLDFMWAYMGHRRFLSRLPKFLPPYLGFKVGLLPRDSAKESTFFHLLAGEPKTDIDAFAKHYCATRLPELMNPEALKTLERHKALNHRIVIASASLDIWLKPLAESLAVELVCTETEVVEGRLSGKFRTPNCNFEEKVRRLSVATDLSTYNKIFAYGDGPGDQAILDIATNPYLNRFPKISDI